MKYKLQYELDHSQGEYLKDPTFIGKVTLKNSLTGTPDLDVELVRDVKTYSIDYYIRDPAGNVVLSPTYMSRRERRNLGEGGFGLVYKGNVKEVGTTGFKEKVIKFLVIDESKRDYKEQFNAEVYIPKLLQLLEGKSYDNCDLTTSQVCITDGYKDILLPGNRPLPDYYGLSPPNRVFLGDSSTQKLGAVVMDLYDGDGEHFIQNTSMFSDIELSNSLGQFLFTSLFSFKNLHTLGFVQCDFKPGNILYKKVTDKPYVRFYFSDFGGISRVFGSTTTDAFIKNILRNVSFPVGFPVVSTPIFCLPKYTGVDWDKENKNGNTSVMLRNSSWELGLSIMLLISQMYSTKRYTYEQYLEKIYEFEKGTTTEHVLLDLCKQVKTNPLPINVVIPINPVNNEFVTVSMIEFTDFITEKLFGYEETTGTFSVTRILEVQNAYDEMMNLINSKRSLLGTIVTSTFVFGKNLLGALAGGVKEIYVKNIHQPLVAKIFTGVVKVDEKIDQLEKEGFIVTNADINKSVVKNLTIQGCADLEKWWCRQIMKFSDSIEFFPKIKSAIIEKGATEADNKYKFLFKNLEHTVYRYITEDTLINILFEKVTKQTRTTVYNKIRQENYNALARLRRYAGNPVEIERNLKLPLYEKRMQTETDKEFDKLKKDFIANISKYYSSLTPTELADINNYVKIEVINNINKDPSIFSSDLKIISNELENYGISFIKSCELQSIQFITYAGVKVNTLALVVVVNYDMDTDSFKKYLKTLS